MVRIRTVHARDLFTLARIYVRVYDRVNIHERWTMVTAKKLLAFWFQQQPDLALCAEKNHQLVGAFLTGIKPWWDGNHLMEGELFVDPAFQQQGIGSLLLQSVFKKAQEKYNAVQFDAFTYTQKAFPLSWYQKLGIQKTTEYAMISGKINETLLILEKKEKSGTGEI